jgi:hypothetical protein
MRRTGLTKLAIAGLALSVLTTVRADAVSGITSGVSGGPFDAVPFGTLIPDSDGKSLVVRWAEPRKIRRVVVEFPANVTPPSPQSVRLQYWHQSWDGRSDPILAEAGAGDAGWAAIDDWTNGRWKEADTNLASQGPTWTYTFKPTNGSEFPSLGGKGVAYRKTLKIRLVSQGPLPASTLVHAYTDATYQPLTVRILLGKPAEPKIQITGQDNGVVEIFNGVLLDLRPLGAAGVNQDPQRHWLIPADGEGGLEAKLLMAVDPTGSGYDRTIVTIRSRFRPFSFAADEVARGDRILVDDLGVLVAKGGDAVTLAGYRDARKEYAGRTVYDRVRDEPEQTLSRAWNDMPLKRPLYFVHGLPGNRNAMRQDADGTIRLAANSRWFKDFPSPRDSSRQLWDGSVHGHGFSFGFPKTLISGNRSLERGYLPLLRTFWQEGPILYEQTTFLDKLDGDLSSVRLDDPTVLRMRVRMTNTSTSGKAEAQLFLHTAPGEDEERNQATEKLFSEGDQILAVYKGKPRLRYLIDRGGRGELSSEAGGVRWRLELGAKESHDLYFSIPSITLETRDEVEALRQLDFEADSHRVCSYWRDKTSKGTEIVTPEPWLNDFYKAHLQHMLVNCYKELNSDLLHAHVGTFDYGVFPNESVMMISDLDRRGYHREAQKNLDALLQYQGTVLFLGNFKSKEGLFYGAGGHQDGDYNKSHGYVMWAMAEHWRMTRDRQWMEAAAPKLVKACDWVIRERQATMKLNSDGSRPLEYGVLPEGSLEDVQDYWHWLATNAATVWGFQHLADALAEFGHPEAARLQKEAQAYHQDVMGSFNEARILAPVVRLRDGTYVPKFPSRLYERGRSRGWLRETLEGPMFLLYYRLIAPESAEAKWILKDYEDNLYISDQYGYSIPAFDQFWFSRGGFSMQANLLDGPPPYLYRDEIKHYLRAYFNPFASACYPETRMCNEHSLPELGYPRGDHFKTSDEAQSTFWLRLMFVHEQGDDLYLGQAIPRYWLAQNRPVGIERAASYFGPLSLRITPNADASEITVALVPPQRNAPKTIYLRLRHPQEWRMQSVTLNGVAYKRFDVGKEWVVLPGSLQGTQELVVRYSSEKK